MSSFVRKTLQVASAARRSTTRSLFSSYTHTRLVPAAMCRSSVLTSRSFAAAAAMEAKTTDMFCYQCEQTENGSGCTKIGVCGKTPETAAMQDLLVHQVKAISQYAHRARMLGAKYSDSVVDNACLAYLFSTLTNVNFDSDRFAIYCRDAQTHRNTAKALYERACKETGTKPEALTNAYQLNLSDFSVKGLEAEGKKHGVQTKKKQFGDDITGLIELIMYGVKGTAAYAEHSHRLAALPDSVFAGLHKALNLVTMEKPDVPTLLGCALEVGGVNLEVMGLLEAGHINKLGTPAPKAVARDPVPGKCILVSGHDMVDMEAILKATEGKGINVYSHGELLPAHSYPNLGKYKHFVGHYGGPWQQQQFEFRAFPGPIVMTTNCMMEPRKSYKKRLFTRTVTGWPGVTHLEANDDWSTVIKCALAEDGFTDADVVPEASRKSFMTGFGKDTILGVAPQVIAAIKSGAIKNFFVIGGCDGGEETRSYFRDLAKGTPDDSVILTLGCGKYRFNDLPLGDIGGIPRVLDMGQCNDSYGAIQVAVALSKALNCGVNDLPLHFAVSWFEQKAVAVLLTLLHLNIQNIHLGPALPGFATPAILDVLVKNYGISPIGTAGGDLKKFLNQ